MMKRLIYLTLLLLLNWFLAKAYLEYTQLNARDFSSFLAMCGTFIQSGFSSKVPGAWDYWLVILAMQVVLYVCYSSLKCLLTEKESTDHIKHKILEK